MSKSALLVLVFTTLLLTKGGILVGYTQLTADFSANKTEGCAPLLVQFTDQSTGNPSNWRWDLGNGTISFLQNPAATYFNPGTYTIKLVVSNGSNKDSIIRTQYITVFASPVLNFTASDSSGCFPLSVQFTDLSNPGTGTISNWLWDFGDGDTSSLQHPQHRYNSLGNYNVSLQVRNSKGCIQSISRLNYIKINSGVNADFTVSTPGTCRPPTPVSFTNTSTGTGILSYQWDFGDGGTSVQANSTHTYTTAGTFSVKLVVRNNNGCIDSIIKPNAITIGTVSAAFTSPSVICAGKSFTILNNSSPPPSSSNWNFGDGSFSSDINPVKTFTTPGNYTIKLVSNFGACADSVSKNIQVLAKPVTDFTGSNTSACKPPLTASFTQTAIGAVSYKWLFGDGDSSSLINPFHTYTSLGNFTVTLITTNAAGCTDTLKRDSFVRILPPQVTISNIPKEGCVPFSFQPAIRIVSTDSIANYFWDFGDGRTSTQPNPVNTYISPGTYTIKLFYTTTGGCADSVIVRNAIKVGERPIVSFTATPRVGCAFQSIHFKDLSTGPPADRWLWKFGDGGTSTEKNPDYNYKDTGWFTVTLIAWNNGCMDSLKIPGFIYIKPPIAKFIDSSGCNNKFTRHFIDRSIGAISWYWDFGDGNTSDQQNPVHTYIAAGSYLVSLTVKNDTCEHSTTRQVLIIAENASFLASDTMVCKGTVVTFSAQKSNAQNIRAYEWNFGDGIVGSNATTGHIYTKTGIYTVQLIITDINGCSDTLRKPQYIKVTGPTANFTSPIPAVCNNTLIQFADSSFSDGIYPIKQWIWNYGDSTSDTLSGPPFQHSYLSPGLFTVSLTVVDSIGCTDKQQKNNYLIISKPFPEFSSPDSFSCTNKSVRFINKTSGNGPFNYEWTLGNNTNSIALQPVTSYATEGDFSVKLVASDRYGCKDSIIKNNYIKIRNPKALFTVSDSVATCPPLVVTFTNQSQNFTRFEWDFGDGTRSTVSNPIHFYTYPGVYKARLTITSIGGCIDTLIKTITVRGPQGTFRYDNTGGCEPVIVGFTGTTKDIVRFIWDFDDGTVTETNDSLINHTYTRRGNYLPKMILKDPQGCQVSVPGIDTIRIYGADAAFGFSKQVLCDSGMVQFTDSSSANDIIKTYIWDFGDGTISGLPNPSHFYKQAGNYPVQLIVQTRRGCADTARINMPIRIVESPVIAISGDTSSCIPALVSFHGSLIRIDTSTIRWQWNFGNGIYSNLQDPLPVSYAYAGNYETQLIAANSSGCADTSFHSFTAYPIPTVEAGPNQAICFNTSTALSGSGALLYNWSPALSLSCTECSSPMAAPLQNTVYYLQGENIYGCYASDSVLITVQQPLNITVSRGDTLCLGESLLLFASGADHFSWTPLRGLDNSRSSHPVAKPETSVVYQVVGSDQYGCFTDTGFIPVVVYRFPTVNAGDDKTISAGTTASIEARFSGDVNSLKWVPVTGLSCTNCPNPVASPRQTTTYQIEVKNEGGCITKDDVTINVFCNNGNLFVPNTFSPNGDGSNDVFYPRGKGLFTIRSLRIFNRWGELVFERINFNANDALTGWDGIFKGKQAPQDVYVYSIEVMCENQTVLTYAGNVALIR